VVTLHDLTFEHFPDWYPRRQTIAFRVQARRAARTAKAILTVSEFVKADIVETYRVDPDRIVVAPHGIDPAFRPDLEVGPLLHRLGVAPRYVIALGGAPRRNTGVAIEAWRQVRSAGLDVDLVVVGGPAPAREAGLVHTVAPPDEEWAALLSGAEVFVYPTTYEGFGMPALEALGAGTPVVAARVGSLPEVLGHTASWCESTRAHDVATALAEVLLDDAMRQRLRSDGFERAAAAPGWPVAAAAHLEAYQRAAS
jgi:alpha-1,3-rhamnosyl/mannosyltransferase